MHKIDSSSDMAEIPLSDESAGTLKMFSLYPQLKDVLEKGSVFFIDELNARLHPLLVRNILVSFINPKINVIMHNWYLLLMIPGNWLIIY